MRKLVVVVIVLLGGGGVHLDRLATLAASTLRAHLLELLHLIWSENGLQLVSRVRFQIGNLLLLVGVRFSFLCATRQDVNGSTTTLSFWPGEEQEADSAHCGLLDLARRTAMCERQCKDGEVSFMWDAVVCFSKAL